ncbi:MAG TPA: ribonuclease HII [Pyrinomonadaceae bacterium]|nr:ribonuclease HII [Pyrinomonadaceae bacterium]
MKEFQLQAEAHQWVIGFDFEDEARSRGFLNIAVLDEVGRGCLAGPVVAAACILDPQRPVPAAINDSKKLTAKQRTEIALELRENAAAFAIAETDAPTIDRINILEATKQAMRAALASLTPAADFLLIDALELRDIRLPQRAIIKGDSISYSIAAASILAKTYRDEMMERYDSEFPDYGFSSHMGYGTRQHYDALTKLGPCPLHRRSFRGVCDADNFMVSQSAELF